MMNPKADIFKINPRVFTISLYVAAAIIGLILAKAFFNFVAAKEKSVPKFTQVEIKQTSSLPPAVSEIEATPAQKSPKLGLKIKKELQESFELNGIFFTDGSGYAIINNRVVKVADEISGATVKRINVDSVELETSGVVFELKNPR